jgi:hypothetical protein
MTMRKPISLTRGAVLSLVMLPIASFVASTLLAVNIAGQQAIERDRERCDELALEIKIRTEVPPPTPVAQALVDAYAKRYHQLNCPNPEDKK